MKIINLKPLKIKKIMENQKEEVTTEDTEVEKEEIKTTKDTMVKEDQIKSQVSSQNIKK